jgi:hypothetical protein
LKERASVGRPFYYRLALAGVLVVGVGMSIYAATAIPAGDPSAPVFVPAAVVVFAIGAVMRRTTKALWLAVVGFPMTLVVIAIDPFRLLHPDSFIDFVPSVLLLAGTATAFVGGTVELVQRRRHTERASTLRERVLVTVGVATLMAVASYSAFVTFSRDAGAVLPDGRTVIAISADEDRWIPNTIALRSPGATLLLVRNPDWFAHTFVVDALDIDVYVGPRSEHVVEVPAPATGTYGFACGVTGHEAMVGTLRVT